LCNSFKRLADEFDSEWQIIAVFIVIFSESVAVLWQVTCGGCQSAHTAAVGMFWN
jgi:hypothetical protein